MLFRLKIKDDLKTFRPKRGCWEHNSFVIRRRVPLTGKLMIRTQAHVWKTPGRNSNLPVGILYEMISWRSPCMLWLKGRLVDDYGEARSWLLVLSTSSMISCVGVSVSSSHFAHNSICRMAKARKPHIFNQRVPQITQQWQNQNHQVVSTSSLREGKYYCYYYYYYCFGSF